MAKPSRAQTALALLLALLGVGAVFLTWDRTRFLGIGDADDGWDRWEGVATAALFGASALCVLLACRREASAWWRRLGYFLLPLATVVTVCCYAWQYVPAGVKARLGSGTRVGAAFREFGGAFKWSSIGVGAYAAFAVAVAIVLLGCVGRPSNGHDGR
jgi:hypothetical protein